MYSCFENIVSVLGSKILFIYVFIFPAHSQEFWIILCVRFKCTYCRRSQMSTTQKEWFIFGLTFMFRYIWFLQVAVTLQS